jgi:hypothetical protein
MNDKIKKSLAEVSIEELLAIVAEKKQAEYQPLVDEYEATESKLNEIRAKIQTINPKWSPRTLADKIVSFLGEIDKPVEEKSIVERFNTVQVGYIKNTLKNNLDVRWTVKDGKYSLATEK